MKHFNHRRFRHVKPVPTGSPARRPAEHRRGDRQRIQRIQRRSGGGVSSCGYVAGADAAPVRKTQEMGIEMGIGDVGSFYEFFRDRNWEYREI